MVSCFRHLKKQSITNKNISKQKTIKQNVLLYILLFLLVFLNGESNSESHDVSFLFVSFLLFQKSASCSLSVSCDIRVSFLGVKS